MCTRDWQRHPATTPQTASAPFDDGEIVVVTLEADGTFRRRFIGCSCAAPFTARPVERERARGVRAWYRRWGSNPHELALIGV